MLASATISVHLSMERAGRVIGKLNLRASDEQLAAAAWCVAVGKKIALRTNAACLIRTRLVVEVEDAVWQRQLFTLRDQILKRLEDVIGRRIVEEVEFRVALPRMQPAMAVSARPMSDESDEIRDPIFRSIYRAARKKATA